jgi:hypothetical protein
MEIIKQQIELFDTDKPLPCVLFVFDIVILLSSEMESF